MTFARLALTVIGVLIVAIGLIWIGQGTGAFPIPPAAS